MRTRSEVAAMLELERRGWSISRIAAEFSVDRKTVRRYIRAGCWTGYKPRERSSGPRAPKAVSVAAAIDHWRGMRADGAINLTELHAWLVAEHGYRGTVSGRSSGTGLEPIRPRGFGREGGMLTRCGENCRRGLYAVGCGGPMERLAISFGGTWQPDYLHGCGCTKLCKGYSRSAASALKAVTQARSVSFYGALESVGSLIATRR